MAEQVADDTSTVTRRGLAGNQSGSSLEEQMGFDFTRTCVEDTSNHRVTADDASIRVEEPATGKSPWTGVWWHKRTTPENQPSNTSYTNQTPSMKPVFTRFQPIECQRRQPPPTCDVSNSLERFEDYEFRWSTNTINSPNLPNPKGVDRFDVSLLQQTEPTVLCLVGWSHSKNFRKTAEGMGINSKTTNITFDHVPAQYPNDATPGFIASESNQKFPRDHPNNCSKLLIGLGQWPASYKLGRPTRVDEYYKEIKDMLVNLKEDPSTKHMDIYMRSIHYNPLGFKHGKCPPKEWRNPATIEAYNAVIKLVCKELDIPFLDATHISGHVWDGSPDWNHLPNNAREAELLYLTAAMLGVGQ